MTRRMNNEDITRAAAQPASCLKKAQFQKAYQILKTVLEDQGSSSRRSVVSFKTLADHYIPNLTQAARIQSYCLEVQTEYKVQVQSSDVACAIFYWVCTSAKVSPLSRTL